MQYGKFKIPDNGDGTVVTYSPGWCGTRERCAQGEKGILYNDEERWGIMQFEGDFVPPNVEVLTEKEATALLEATKEKHKDNPKVFFSEKLATRWDSPPPKTFIDDNGIKVNVTPERADVKITFCKKCKQVAGSVYLYDNSTISVVQNGRTIINGLRISATLVPNIIISCPSGHKINAMTGEAHNG
jgi:hypothetical protein